MLFRFLFRNLKGFRLLVIVAIAITFLEVGCDILVALPLKFVPDKIKDHMEPSISLLGGLLPFFDRFGTKQGLKPWEVHTQLGIILFGVCMLIVFGILSSFFTYIQLRLASYIAQHLAARLRKLLFEHLQRLSLEWHGRQKKGDLVQRITGNIADIEKLVTDGLIDLLAGILTLAGVITVMLLVSPPFTLISLVIAPALIVIVFSYTKSIKAATKKASKAAGKVANVATEDLGVITLLKAFTLELRESMRFSRYVGKNREAALRAGKLQAQFTPLVTILIALGTSIILGVGSYVAANNALPLVFFSIQAQSITIGTLLLFLTYLKMLYQPMRDLSKLTNLASSAGSGAERIQEVLDQAPEVLESATPYYGPTKLKGDIIFENVTFGYTPTRSILKDLTLHIPAGRKVALVGLSGGGKTTLVKLIPRFYEIEKGIVKIDNVDHREYPLKLLRQNISFVLQESVLFEGTISENIGIGKPGATMEEVVEAAKKAHIHDTIMDLPDGYETEVYEQGKNFSGGQRQRLAIARAILRDAPILILDEPTASLDVEAEAEVIRALDTLIVNRTVLMISHRLSTLGNVDQIIVLKHGRIIEQGTYKELKHKGGVFAGLLAEQNRYNLERASDKSIIKPVIPAQKVPEQLPVPPRPIAPSHRMMPLPIPGRNSSSTNKQSVGRDRPQNVAMALKARVWIEMDGKIVGERQLNKPLLTVGRHSSNDVQIRSQHVSRLHAKIWWGNGTWFIEDSDSLFGLVYQGHRVDQHIFTNGDRVYVSPKAVLHYESMP